MKYAIKTGSKLLNFYSLFPKSKNANNFLSALATHVNKINIRSYVKFAFHFVFKLSVVGELFHNLKQ